MKPVIAPVLIAIVLAVAGALFWTEGKTEARLAEAHRQLAVLQYAAAQSAGEEVLDATELARIRALAGNTPTDVRRLRTTAQYWSAEYDALAPTRDATGALTEADAQVLLVDANASFRASQHDADRNTTLGKLDTVVKNYAEVLKANPNLPDVAYNYEYAVRMRDILQRGRQAPSSRQPSSEKSQKINAEIQSGDLPAGPTIHGHPGGPPARADMSQFKIVIPKRGDERKDDPQAGKGGVKVRKG